MRKKLDTVTAHRDQNGHSQPWLSCDLAVTEPWSYWRCSQPAVTLSWLSCDLAVTELWPRRDWAVTWPSRDWASDHWAPEPWPTWSPWAHHELTVTTYFLMGHYKISNKPHSYFCDWSVYICLIWGASQMYRFMNKLFLFQESFSNLQYTINYANASELFNMHEFTGIPSLTQGSFWAGPSQWDSTSHCNAVSHWLSPCPEWSLKKLSLPDMNHILVILPNISIST